MACEEVRGKISVLLIAATVCLLRLPSIVEPIEALWAIFHSPLLLRKEVDKKPCETETHVVVSSGLDDESVLGDRVSAWPKPKAQAVLPPAQPSVSQRQEIPKSQAVWEVRQNGDCDFSVYCFSALC